jgi:hypothetical protein
MNDGFDWAQYVWNFLIPKEHIIGRCVFCERDIYKHEEDITEIDGLLAHTKCKKRDEEREHEE